MQNEVRHSRVIHPSCKALKGTCKSDYQVFDHLTFFEVLERVHPEKFLEILGEIGGGIESYGIHDPGDVAMPLPEHACSQFEADVPDEPGGRLVGQVF
jgi:hypothetical protein